MIKEAYCSYKVSKLLKEKGFNVPTHAFYNPKKSYTLKFDPCLIDRNAGIYVSAPTHQMAMDWLRKKGIAIIPIISGVLDNEEFLWNVNITIAKTAETYTQGWRYEEYEDVVDDALEYCLENLDKLI